MNTPSLQAFGTTLACRLVIRSGIIPEEMMPGLIAYECDEKLLKTVMADVAEMVIAQVHQDRPEINEPNIEFIGDDSQVVVVANPLIEVMNEDTGEKALRPNLQFVAAEEVTEAGIYVLRLSLAPMVFPNWVAYIKITKDAGVNRLTLSAKGTQNDG